MAPTRKRSALEVVALSIVLTMAVAVGPALSQAAALTPFTYMTHAGPTAGVSVVNTATNTVAGNIETPSQGNFVAITPDGAFAYVTLEGGNRVAVVDTSTDVPVAVVTVGGSPEGLAVTPDGASVYVANASGTVSVISTATNTVTATATIPGPSRPVDVAITPNGQFAYVTNDTGTVSVISTATHSFVGSVPVGSFPKGIAITPNGAFAYVTNLLGATVSVIDTATNTVVATIPVGQQPADVAVTPDGAFAYVTDNSSNDVVVVDTATNTVVGAVPLGHGASESVAFTPNGAFAYVSGGGGRELVVVNTALRAVVSDVFVGNSGAGSQVAVSPPIAGPSSAPVVIVPPPAATPPVVKILSGPAKESADHDATFTFAGVAGGVYECSLDSGSWSACASGKRYASVVPGDHLFQVRETLGGLTGPTARYRWTVDLPRSCVLKVARARVFAFAHQGKARLVIRYKAYHPAEVRVSYALTGSRGALDLGTATSRFHTAGVFRLGKSLSQADLAKLGATTSMKVRFSIPEAPATCARFYTKRLTIPKKIFGQTVWFQSDSLFGPEAK